MIMRSREEKDLIKKFILDRDSLTAAKLLDALNSQTEFKLSAPANLSVVNYMRRNRPDGSVQKKVRKKTVGGGIETTNGEEISFSGLMKKIDEVNEYAEKLKKKFGDQIHKLFLA